MGIQSCAILVTTWVVPWENVQLQYCKIIELSAQYKMLNCSDTSEKVCCRSMSLYHIIVQTVIATRSQKLLHTVTSSPFFARMLQLSLHPVHIQLTSSVLLHTWFSVAWHAPAVGVCQLCIVMCEHTQSLNQGHWRPWKKAYYMLA